MSGARPLLRVTTPEDYAEVREKEIEVEWSKITFADLQDLLFESESESESEEEESCERSGMKRLQDKAKVANNMLLEKKEGLFPDGKMTVKVDYQALAELESMWSEITPQEFVMTLYAMGPEGKQMDYMNSLLVEVDPALLPRKQRKHVHNITMLFSGASATWSERKAGSVPRFDAKQPGLSVNCSLFDRMAVPQVNCCGIRHRGLEVVHRFAYTTTTSLFKSTDPRDQAYVLKALADAGRSSLGTPMGRAIMLDTWLISRWEFFYEGALSVCYLCLFLWASVKIRHGYVPDVNVLIPLFSLSVWTVFTKVVETIAALKLFQSLYVMSTSLVLMSIELFNATTVIAFLLTAIGDAGEKCIPPQCLLMSHLASLSLSIFFKWAHFISALLCLRMFGERVLPAAYTMCSPESVRFLLVIGMLVMASFSAYFAFPIPGTVPEAVAHNASMWDYVAAEAAHFRFEHGQFLVPQSTFKMLLRMFNLDLMGDFDLLDLEGQNQVVKFNASALQRLREMASGSPMGNNQTITLAEISDPEPRDTVVHQGVSMLLVVLCIFVNVITMNIYIGLLSSVYERYSSQRWELLAEYKTIHVLRNKLSNPINLLSYFDCTRAAYWRGRKCWPCANPPANRAIWFAFRNEEFPADEGADTAPVLAQLANIRKEVQDVRQLVDRRT